MIGLDYSKLIEILKKPPSVPRPIVLPDFFLDHFVITDNLEDLLSSMKEVAKQGGGNILGSNQFIRRGGNAVNTAAALHTLGLNPRVIVTTDDYGASILRSLVSPGLDLSLVHTDGRMSTTVSIEAETDCKGGSYITASTKALLCEKDCPSCGSVQGIVVHFPRP